jgi:hypothetical protein
MKATWMGLSSLLVTSINALVGRPLTSLTPKMSASGNVATISALSFDSGTLAVSASTMGG